MAMMKVMVQATANAAISIEGLAWQARSRDASSNSMLFRFILLQDQIQFAAWTQKACQVFKICESAKITLHRLPDAPKPYFQKRRQPAMLASTLMNDHFSEKNTVNRRKFLTISGAALGAAGLAGLSPASANAAETGRKLVGKNDVVLFQGDSITDAGRSREKAGTLNDQAAMGSGYAWLAGAELLVDRPKDGLKVFNRGISGNKVFQLADRWQADCLDLKPNVLSILIGVNDIWHKLDGKYQGTVETYERDYRALLERTRKALPKVKLVICEPFVLRCGAINDKWFPEFDEYRAAAKRVAGTFRATFVPFQTMFDEAVKYAPAEHWANDGVHPSAAGASLMAHEWLRAV
ncbi:MAG: Lipolytic protein family [Pedosphaera sp.]|nr:Lipolytic protein family [Pedosphaera sp.]